MFKKILIANRGEIAVRIIRACKEMKIRTVAIYSTADKDALHVQIADEAICIGGPKPAESYLNMANILSAACNAGCDAIHPGFGFLAENPIFARLVAQCKLVFIGPTAEAIEQMGNKAKAREIMIKAKVPVVPGSVGVVENAVDGLAFAKEVEFPVLIKASAGGGGRGMRVSYNEDDFKDAFISAKGEAKACFGDDSVYVEKLVTNPKHVEVQVMGDKHGNYVHLFERDCSMQRRKQKILEEAPCYSLTDDVKEKMFAAAIKACKAVKYDSVGTVEFLYSNGKFYFIEMNTRIQVEHPVTEMITDIDIVKQQIRIAEGGVLPFAQEDIKKHGYSMECRINAEDIYNNFNPTCGKIKFIHTPGGKGIRIDSAVYNNYEIPPFYDSMILKLIVFAKTRIECIKKMRAALEELIIDGVKTNVEFHYMLLHSPTFLEGNYDTSFIQNFIKELEDSGKFIYEA